jgi:hypothetical protein
VASWGVCRGMTRDVTWCCQLVEKLGEHLKGKESDKDIRQGITKGFVELNEMVRVPPSPDGNQSPHSGRLVSRGV